MANDNVSHFPKIKQTPEEAAIAYYSRHGVKDGSGVKTVDLISGLRILRNEEGLWLDFKSPDGLLASVHMDMIGPQGHSNSIVQKTINAWCESFVEDQDYPPANDHIERLKKEISELHTKLVALDTFVQKNQKYKELPGSQQLWMRSQYYHMEEYHKCLLVRYDYLTLPKA